MKMYIIRLDEKGYFSRDHHWTHVAKELATQYPWKRAEQVRRHIRRIGYSNPVIELIPEPIKEE